MPQSRTRTYIVGRLTKEGEVSTTSTLAHSLCYLQRLSVNLALGICLYSCAATSLYLLCFLPHTASADCYKSSLLLLLLLLIHFLSLPHNTRQPTLLIHRIPFLTMKFSTLSAVTTGTLAASIVHAAYIPPNNGPVTYTYDDASPDVRYSVPEGSWTHLKNQGYGLYDKTESYAGKNGYALLCLSRLLAVIANVALALECAARSFSIIPPAPDLPRSSI